MHPSIFSMTWVGMTVAASRSRAYAPGTVFVRSRHTGNHGSAACYLPFAAGSSVPYDARPGSPGFDTEVSHATQERAPRRRLVSRSPVNEGRASLPRLGSNAECASSAAAKSSERSSAATIHARVSLAGDFKNCCMLSGEFDGSDRDHFFQRVTAASNNHWSGPWMSVVGAAGARGQFAPAAPIWRFCAAAQLHR